MSAPVALAARDEIGALGIKQLKRFWSASIATRAGRVAERENEGQTDRLLLDALGLGLHQTMQYIFLQGPDFTEFERWIVATAGQPDGIVVERFNAVVCAAPMPRRVREWLEGIEDHAPVLSADDLSRWEEQGYVVVQDAISPEHRAAAEAAIWEYSGAIPGQPESWYPAAAHGIMLLLIQHPALQANRWSPRAHKAFSQLWKTPDLWAAADRCGFHPPQRSDHPFPGPDLHWDIDFEQPLTFATQGILYLTDTAQEQGALTLVPGFHRRIRDWLRQLPADSDPNAQDLHALGSKSIGGRAGDLIVWHHLLPHGASPNRCKLPRIVQYVNMHPSPGVSIPVT